MDGKKIKILIVDDDNEIRSMYAEVFKREGFVVEEAMDGVDGLDKATKNVPNIIFTGIIMPVMDGFGLKDALAKNVNTANIPVVMLSHMGREEDRVKALSLGIKEFIVQGMISPRQVVEKVRNMFSGHGEYQLKFNTIDLDAHRLASDLHLNPGFSCEKCSEKMILSLHAANADNREFSARFICPNCEIR
jgi:two-component system chemotaxis response regulator CheY